MRLNESKITTRGWGNRGALHCEYSTLSSHAAYFQRIINNLSFWANQIRGVSGREAGYQRNTKKTTEIRYHFRYSTTYILRLNKKFQLQFCLCLKKTARQTIISTVVAIAITLKFVFRYSQAVNTLYCYNARNTSTSNKCTSLKLCINTYQNNLVRSRVTEHNPRVKKDHCLTVEMFN